jgi:hypothetical protein
VRECHQSADGKIADVIDRTEAERIAAAVVAEKSRGGVECVLVAEHTREEPFGWVFFYQSVAFLRSGETRNRLAGNSPLVVFRDTGEVRATGTAHPLDYYLEPIREEWSRRQAELP